MTPRTNLIEVSVTDHAPNPEGESSETMKFIGYTDEETTRIVLFEMPSTEGREMLRALEAGEEPVAYCEEKDFIIKVPQRFPNLPQMAMSPLAALATKVVIGPEDSETPQKSEIRSKLEVIALTEIEKAALASNELDAARKSNENVFEAAQEFRKCEANMRKAIEDLVLKIAEENR